MHIISRKKDDGYFVTHDLSLVKDYATHVSIMQHGQIIESGQAQQVMHHPERHYTQTLTVQQSGGKLMLQVDHINKTIQGRIILEDIF